jgi:methylornithine synthase
MNRFTVDDILRRAVDGISLTHDEICSLLALEDSRQVERVMEAARRLRERFFGNKVFLYGFIYFSTYCRNHCSFCFYRRNNPLSPRYRKDLKQVLEIARGLAESGVHLVDLTMGEDPLIYEEGDFDILFRIIGAVKDRTGLPVMVSPGVVPHEVLLRFPSQGVDWYALYQETHNPLLYAKLRLGQSFEERKDRRKAARQMGMLVEDGILLGVGERISDRAHSFLTMKRAGVHQARVMSLVPQPQTPLAGMARPDRDEECLCIAVMRLIMPDRLIPASLDVDGIKGLKMRLEAGANVVTSIIPPHSNLAGVSQSTLDIEQGLRTVPEVKKVLAEADLQAAALAEYMDWITLRKEKTAQENFTGDHRYRRRTAPGFGGCLFSP